MLQQTYPTDTEKQEKLNDSPKYQAWLGHLKDNQLKTNNIQPLHIQRANKDGSVLYALLNVDADTPEGIKLNPICFL